VYPPSSYPAKIASVRPSAYVAAQCAAVPSEHRLSERSECRPEAGEHHVWRMFMPPSTTTTAPLRNDAAGSTSDTVIWATSSGSP
jgi:hypothetical protein